MRLTINVDPVGDVEYLGDRSLLTFITTENNKDYIYFASYHYGFVPEDDVVNEFYSIDVTGFMNDWFYSYAAVSVER